MNNQFYEKLGRAVYDKAAERERKKHSLVDQFCGEETRGTYMCKHCNYSGANECPLTRAIRKRDEDVKKSLAKKWKIETDTTE